MVISTTVRKAVNGVYGQTGIRKGMDFSMYLTPVIFFNVFKAYGFTSSVCVCGSVLCLHLLVKHQRCKCVSFFINLFQTMLYSVFCCLSYLRFNQSWQFNKAQTGAVSAPFPPLYESRNNVSIGINSHISVCSCCMNA